MASAALLRSETTPARSGAAALADLVEAAERIAPGSDAARILADMTDLLVARAGDLSASQVGAFDEVMTVLAEGAGTQSRGRLARRVGPLPRPPRRLTRHLAWDPEASVAVPVLARCASLPEEVLLRVARSRGPAHLAAIARRETVAVRVADILADRGDEAVMGTLLRNPGAQLSLSALSLLSERMQDRDGLARGLDARPGLRPTQRAALLRRREPERPGPQRRALEAFALRIRLGLEEADIRLWLAESRIAEALLGLAHLAGCAPERAESSYRAQNPAGLALLVRAAGLRLSTLGAFLRARSGPALTSEHAGAAVEAYRAMTVAEARGAAAADPRPDGAVARRHAPTGVNER
ncbi:MULTISPECIES: DUF2336 domain-containing protein [Methylobacterium]|uniref:DUF2336 domain-containing protein n=1 Tax=Methylobacterium TaxID=407 RepID=UPI00272E00E1|nr:DUF2336 domain-containing protein [Methylobacterium sp.]